MVQWIGNDHTVHIAGTQALSVWCPAATTHLRGPLLLVHQYDPGWKVQGFGGVAQLADNRVIADVLHKCLLSLLLPQPDLLEALSCDVPYGMAVVAPLVLFLAHQDWELHRAMHLRGEGASFCAPLCGCVGCDPPLKVRWKWSWISQCALASSKHVLLSSNAWFISRAFFIKSLTVCCASLRHQLRQFFSSA